MNFGRREQKVVLGIAFLGTVGALHMLVFSGRSAAYKEALLQKTRKDNELRAVSTIRDPGSIKRLNDDSELMEGKIKEVVGALQMTIPSVFFPPSGEEIQTHIAAGATQEDAVRLAREARYDQQLELVLVEIRKLLAFDKRRAGGAAGNSDMLFLGEVGEAGWRLPTELPPNARGGRLFDLLRDLRETLDLILGLSRDNPDAIIRQRNIYNAILAELGGNNEIYKDTSPTSLAAQGDYVPLVHKMVFAELILDAVTQENAAATDREIGRRDIYRWLEIDLPFANLQGLSASDMYLFHAQLEHLNRLLELMVADEIAQVFGVVLERPGFVVNREHAGSHDHKTPGPWQSFEPIPSAFVVNFGNELETAPPPPPTIAAQNPDADLGYCLPITVQFKATNRNAWKFMYDVLLKFPMAEVDQVRVFSNRQDEESGDLFFMVRFMFVPYLFGLPAS